MSSTEEANDKADCAHITVFYIHNAPKGESGFGEWKCSDCGERFVPDRSAQNSKTINKLWELYLEFKYRKPGYELNAAYERFESIMDGK